MKSHPLIDEFIPTIEGEDGICYTHPEKLPGQKFQYYLYICYSIPSILYYFSLIKLHAVLGLICFHTFQFVTPKST